jgi:hypothetical protein
MSEEREERDLLLWRAQVVALLQENNTLALESLSELRHIARDVKSLADALPQPPGQLKRTALVFGAST